MSGHDHDLIVREMRSRQPLDGRRRKVLPVQPEATAVLAAEMVPEVVQPAEIEELDLDAELDKLISDAARNRVDSEVEEPVSTEEVLRTQILDMFYNHKDAPTPEMIAGWKKKYGENGVQVIAFDSETVYVFTHLTYSQWEKLQEAQRKGGPDITKAMTDTVLKMAILWPKITPDHFANNRAGLYQTLYEQILVNSYFLSPQQAITLTTRL